MQPPGFADVGSNLVPPADDAFRDQIYVPPQHHGSQGSMQSGYQSDMNRGGGSAGGGNGGGGGAGQ